MTQTDSMNIFRKSYLAMAVGFCTLSTAHAMQALSDESLSDSTGEGVAFVLDDFKMIFQRPNDVSAASSYQQLNVQNPSQEDTGFIRIIPTGGNYAKLYEQTKQRLYNTSFQENYYNKLPSLYAATYDATYNVAYQEYQANPDNLAKITALKQKDYEAIFNSNYQPYRSSATWQTRYDTVYKARRTSQKIGLCIEPYCAYKETEKESAAYSESVVRGEIDTQFNISGKTQATIDRNIQDAYTASSKFYASQRAKTKYKDEMESLRLRAVSIAETTVANADLGAELKASKTKADIFIYGLALSASNGDLNQRYSNKGLQWGTAQNPWIFRAGNQDVQQFAANNTKKIGYIALEAPLAKQTLKSLDTTKATDAVRNDSDNNIKLGFWMDIFARGLDSSAAVNTITGAPVVAADLDVNYRLRTQFVANGLSLDGSQVRVFQTLPNVKILDQSETLGMAALLRLNTDDDPSKITFQNESGLSNDALAQARTKNATLNAHAIRLSTAEQANDKAGDPSTPALVVGGKAPLFNQEEGLYLYSPNINLVLGNMNQPFVVGSEGNNIVLEITRIPNVPAIYNSIYQNYKSSNYRTNDAAYNTKNKLTEYLGDASAQGSTCNVYSCGNEFVTTANPLPQYQGRNATHSSIAIGSVERLPGNLLNAKRENDSTGIVFRDTKGTSVNLGSVAIDGVLIQHLKIKSTGL